MCSGPNLEQSVPTSCRECFPILGDSETGHTVVMSDELIHHRPQLCVPGIAIVVIIPCEDDLPGLGESDGSDPAHDLVIPVTVQLEIGSDIEQTTAGIIRTCHEGIPVRKELYTVDIGFMTRESLHTVLRSLCPVIPELRRRITAPGHEVVLGIEDRDTHDIVLMIREDGFRLSGLHIPEDAGGITAGGQDLIISDEACTAEIPFVTCEFTDGFRDVEIIGRTHVRSSG